MGLFGGGDDDATKDSNRLIDEQLNTNAAEIEAKRQSLYRERLDIIKGSGGQSFVPDRTSGVSSSSSRPGFHMPKPFNLDKYRPPNY